MGSGGEENGARGEGTGREIPNAAAHDSIAQRVAVSSSGTLVRSFWTSCPNSISGGWVPTAIRSSWTMPYCNVRNSALISASQAPRRVSSNRPRQRLGWSHNAGPYWASSCFRIWRGRLSIRCLHGPSRVMPLSPLKRQVPLRPALCGAGESLVVEHDHLSHCRLSLPVRGQ